MILATSVIGGFLASILEIDIYAIGFCFFAFCVTATCDCFDDDDEGIIIPLSIKFAIASCVLSFLAFGIACIMDGGFIFAVMSIMYTILMSTFVIYIVYKNQKYHLKNKTKK